MDDFNFGDLDFSSTDFGAPEVSAQPATPVAPQPAPVQPQVQQAVSTPVQPTPVAPVQPQVQQAVSTPVAPQPAPVVENNVAPVNLDQAASEAESFTIPEVQFGQRVSTSPIEAYKAVVGVSARVRFVSDKPIPIKAHYLAKTLPSLGKRSIICTGGSCCKYGDPFIKYAFGMMVYPVIPGTRPMQPDTTQKPQLKVLLAGQKLYQQLIDIYEANGTILGTDFGLSNSPQGEFVTTNCVVVPGDWSVQFPTYAEEAAKWDKLKGKCWQAVGNYKTEQEIREAIQKDNYQPPVQPDFQMSDFGL